MTHSVLKRLHVPLVLAAVALLGGCATTEYSAVEQPSSMYLRLQDDVRELHEKLAALSQNLDNLQSQLNLLEREQENQAALIRQLQNDMRKSLDTLARVQRTELEKFSADLARQRSELDNQRVALDQTTKNLTAAVSRDTEQYDRKLADVVKTVQDENATLQRKLTSDLQALQRDLKALQSQVNANSEHIVRVETHLQSIAARALPTPPATPPTTPPSSAKPSATPIVRTGTPSSPDIDYSQGYSHTVVAGETLWKIARDYNVTVQDILNTNPNITDTSRLSPGQKLFIPYRKPAGQ
ncbi:MAG: LysM peptidoglycan-binding domain-containing protein [bacterium]|nr:LysM peptidoglycan-binding domain-containing protein [bacterium]